MPSRSNRLRNRKALTGNDASDEDDIALLSEGEATSSSSTPTPSKRPSRTAASRPRTRGRPSKTAPAEPPNRLRRLMSILLATTLLLALYQGARLYVRSSLEVSSTCGDDGASVGPLAKVGRGNVGEFVKSLWTRPGQQKLPAQKQQQRAQVQHQAIGGGMVLHPSANDDDDASSSNPLAPVLSSDNSDIKLEDLDMDTLQAAFDALYGDDGPLGPQRGGRGDGEGEEGAYRVGRMGRREGLNA